MTVVDFKSFIEDVKRRVDLADVIDATGAEWRINRRWHGEYMRCQAHDSLVVNPGEGYYVWNSKGERGDAFSWLEARHGWDFMRCLEYLAQMAGLEMPVFDQAEGALHSARAEHDRERLWTAATDVFIALLNECSEAMRYCTDATPYQINIKGEVRGVIPRGWDLSVLVNARVGYNGGGKPEARERMTAALQAVGAVEMSHPDCVAVLGWKGDVSEWGKRYGVENIPENWRENGYIPGLLGRTRLIYPHLERGKTVYFSARNILGGEVLADGREVKSFNPPELIAGPRRLYRNWLVSRKVGEFAVVEGQGDAVSLGQMDLAAVAFMGLAPERYQADLDALRFVKGEGGEKERTIYLGVDADQAGDEALVGIKQDWPMARALGATSWVVRWNEHPDAGLRVWDGSEKALGDQALSEQGENPPPASPLKGGDDSDGGKVGVKDANDLLRGMAQRGMGMEAQGTALRELLGAAEIQIVSMAKWAGGMRGAKRADAERVVFGYLLGLDEGVYRQYEKALKAALKRSDLKAVLDSLKREQQKGKSLGGNAEPVEVVSGFVDEHMLETIFDQEAGETRLAIRYPDGRVECEESLVVDGLRYIPISPTDALLKSDIVLFPSALVPVRATRETAGIIRQYIHRYVDIDPFYERLASFYVIFSWLFDCFPQLCYLRALGDYGTGKTRFITTIGAVCYKPILTAGATSVASIFRLLDRFRGTLILDEADFANSNETADIIKILNVGNDSRLGNVLKTEDTGGGKYMPVPYKVYGPKVIATRKKFGDAATESRCLTKEMGGGLVRDDIPKVLQEDFWNQAKEIRNILLAYRMKWWAPTIKIDYNEEKSDVEPRLIQVTLPLKTIIGQNEPDLLEDLNGFIQRYNNQLRAERSMTIEAKVVEAVVRLGTVARTEAAKAAEQISFVGPAAKVAMAAKAARVDAEGNPKIYLKEIATKANDLIDTENDEGEDERESKFRKKLTSKSIGHYLRTKLQCSVDRDRNGFYLVWEERRMEALRMRFGVEE